MAHVLSVIGAVVWLAGIVLAKGFWLTALAICVPFYAWYLVVERGMQMLGMVP
jgi:hypothetical protein